MIRTWIFMPLRRFELLYTRSMEKPRESHEMKELKAFLEDAPEELKNLQVLVCRRCILIELYPLILLLLEQVKMRSVAKKMDFLYVMGKEISEEDMHLNTTW
jgi:hypothetical protein